MQIETNKVVAFHYSVTDDAGVEVDSSRPRGEPLFVLMGGGNIIPGLEKALLGHSEGDRFSLSIPPQDAYGERQEGLIQRVPKKYFQHGDRLKPGMTTVLQLREGGERVVTVAKVGMTTIDVDLNHPLAGVTLNFDVEVTTVRDATPEELEHGHAHGPGGHHH